MKPTGAAALGDAGEVRRRRGRRRCNHRGHLAGRRAGAGERLHPAVRPGHGADIVAYLHGTSWQGGLLPAVCLSASCHGKHSKICAVRIRVPAVSMLGTGRKHARVGIRSVDGVVRGERQLKALTSVDDNARPDRCSCQVCRDGPGTAVVSTMAVEQTGPERVLHQLETSIKLTVASKIGDRCCWA